MRPLLFLILFCFLNLPLLSSLSPLLAQARAKTTSTSKKKAVAKRKPAGKNWKEHYRKKQRRKARKPRNSNAKPGSKAPATKTTSKAPPPIKLDKQPNFFESKYFGVQVGAFWGTFLNESYVFMELNSVFTLPPRLPPLQILVGCNLRIMPIKKP